MKNWKSHLTLWSVVWLGLTQAAIGQVDEGLRARKLQRLGAGSRGTVALDINDRGQIVGYSRDHDFKDHAVRWNKRGKVKSLPCSESITECTAVAINNKGDAVSATRYEVQNFAVVWGANGETKKLSTLPGKTVSAAYDLNDAGWVVGGAWTVSTYDYYGTLYDIRDASTPVVWKKPQHPHALRPLPGETAIVEAEALAVNNSKTGIRQVVGYTLYDGIGTVATAWDGQGEPSRLPPLPGQFESVALGVNADSIAVGFSVDGNSFPESEPVAVVWGEDGHPVALSLLEGCSASRAEDINDAGFVVGSCSNCGYREAPVPVIWDPNGEVILLPLRGKYIEGEALAINSRGDVVGWARRAYDTKVGIVWR